MNYEWGVTVPYRHLDRIGQLTHTHREWLLHGSGPRAFGETLDRLDRAVQVHQGLVETQLELLRTQTELLDQTKQGRTG